MKITRKQLRQIIQEEIYAPDPARQLGNSESPARGVDYIVYDRANDYEEVGAWSTTLGFRATSTRNMKDTNVKNEDIIGTPEYSERIQAIRQRGGPYPNVNLTLRFTDPRMRSYQ